MDPFLISILVGSEWSASRPGRSIPMERAPINLWVGEWVYPGGGLGEVERRLPKLEPRSIGRLARSESVYRLFYPFKKMFKVPPKSELGSRVITISPRDHLRHCVLAQLHQVSVLK
jgi:hypothetical protein